MRQKPIPEEENNIRESIRNKLEEIKAKNPSYSLRALAQKLKINAGTLSSFINGKRSLSVDILHELLKDMDFDPLERKALLARTNALLIESIKSGSEAVRNLKKLSPEESTGVTDIGMFELLSLIETSDFRTDLDWIGQQLSMPVEKVKSIISQLLGLGLVKFDQKYELSRTFSNISTSDDKSNATVKALNRQFMEKALLALKNVPVDKRDITFLVMAANPEKVGQAKELIRKFQDDMMALLEQEPRNEVYVLTIQLFPAKT